MAKISVVIPLYNKGHYILRTINSVLSQTFQEFELIIINDASTDGGEKVVKSIKDNRIKLFNRESPGPGGHAARNRGITESSSDLIAFLDADDVYKPKFLETILSLKAKYPNAGAYSTSYEVKETNGKIFKPKYKAIPPFPWEGIIPNYFESALGPPPVWTSATAVLKNVFNKVQNFPEGEALGGDLDMWLRIALKYPIAFSNYTGATYFKNATNRICNKVLPLNGYCLISTAQKAIDNKEITLNEELFLKEYINGLKIKSAKYNILFGKSKDAKIFLYNCNTTKYFKQKLWWLFWSNIPYPIIKFSCWIKFNIINRIIT